MCGIAGFWAIGHSISADEGASLNRHMTNQIHRRGPDSDGHWNDHENGIFLGHRRLSIIDLSDAGAQPMTSHDGQLVMVFNGEIYNYQEIIKQLKSKKPDIVFKGHSDSEVLLGAFSIMGIEQTLNIMKGMFAIALWDKRSKTLTLMRDHIGKKPLYIGRIGKKIAFASELKALIPLFEQTPKINKEALEKYKYFGFIPAPDSIYQDVFKLPAAHMATLNAEDLMVKPASQLITKASRYWTIAKNDQPNDAAGLKTILQSSVSDRMMSDVPLGAFLSGGIDSSLITALMQEQSQKPIKSYSIGFTDKEFDESMHAEKVAKHLGTDHTTYHVSEKETQAIIPKLPSIYDEPFADYSQIPTAILCQQAKKDTTVVLSGDGGDEVFCGYKRYFMLKKLLDATKHLPRKSIAGLLKVVPQNTYNKIGLKGKRLHSIASFLQEPDLQSAILRTLCVNPDTPQPQLNLPLNSDLTDLEKMMMIDTHLYLPDDILVKVDRASMFSSLEVRSPLLDKDLMEYAWAMPIKDKVFDQQGRGKKPLYNLLCSYVPEELVNRPKQGFTPPIGAWLKSDLREWAEDLLAQDTGLYGMDQTKIMWREFITGRADHHHALWSMLMAQSWYLNIDNGFSTT